MAHGLWRIAYGSLAYRSLYGSWSAAISHKPSAIRHLYPRHFNVPLNELILFANDSPSALISSNASCEMYDCRLAVKNMRASRR